MTPVSANAPTRPSVRRGVVPAWRDLWQVPLFCLGLIALCAVWWLRPAQADSQPTILQAYEKAHLALDLNDLDSAERWLAAIKQLPPDDRLHAAQIQYLRGSLLLAQARQRYPLPAAADAKPHYKEALRELDNLINQVTKMEQPRLNYRLLIAKLGSEGVSAPLLDQIEQVLDVDFPDRLDGFDLLSQLRLLQEPADLVAAVRALDRLLVLPNEQRRHDHLLLKAQYLAQLEKWAEVTKTASLIPVDAKDEYQEALQLKALAAYHQKQWGDAVKLWSLIPAHQQSPRTLLFFGLSQQMLHDLSEANKLWERLRSTYPQSPEAAKATAALAQLAADQFRWSEAVSYAIVLLQTQSPQKFSNPYLTLDDMQRQLSDLAESLTKLRRWEDLRLLGEAALPWSQKGQVEMWLAQAWHALAEAADKSTPASVSQLDAYRQAADYALRAAAVQKPAEKKKSLTLAGQDALRAKAYPLAQQAYGELLTLAPEPHERPLILIGLAEALQARGQLDFALDRLREAAQTPGPHEATVHLRLYRLLHQADRFKEANQELEKSARLVDKPDANADAKSAAHQWALVLYHLASIDRKEISRAIEAGDRALKYAPKHPCAAQTKYLLAELLLADAHFQLDDLLKESSRKNPIVSADDPDNSLLRNKATQFWTAYLYFQAAEQELAQADADIYMNDVRPIWIRFARFSQAECLYHLGRLRPFAPALPAPNADTCWNQAARIYEEISGQTEFKIETLNSLKNLALCQRERGLRNEMSETLRRALQYLDEMADTDFTTIPLGRFESIGRAAWKARLLYLLEAPSQPERRGP